MNAYYNDYSPSSSCLDDPFFEPVCKTDAVASLGLPALYDVFKSVRVSTPIPQPPSPLPNRARRNAISAASNDANARACHVLFCGLRFVDVVGCGDASAVQAYACDCAAQFDDQAHDATPTSPRSTSIDLHSDASTSSCSTDEMEPDDDGLASSSLSAVEEADELAATCNRSARATDRDEEHDETRGAVYDAAPGAPLLHQGHFPISYLRVEQPPRRTRQPSQRISVHDVMMLQAGSAAVTRRRAASAATLRRRSENM